VLLVGSGDTVTAQAEAVLAKLRFAVATSSTVDDALRVMTGIRPDVVVADSDAAARIRPEAPEHLPIVVINDEMRADPDRFVEGIRQSLRAVVKRI
jgi:hypothetical protein